MADNFNFSVARRNNIGSKHTGEHNPHVPHLCDMSRLFPYKHQLMKKPIEKNK